MANLQFSTVIAAKMLQCGYADVDFIGKELDSFQVDLDDLDIFSEDAEVPIDANTVLHNIYLKAVENAGVDMDTHEVSIFTNCLDSHLSLDGEEMYSYDDLLQFAEPEEEN